MEEFEAKERLEVGGKEWWRDKEEAAASLRRGGWQTRSESGGSLVETLRGNLIPTEGSDLAEKEGFGGPSSRDDAIDD